MATSTPVNGTGINLTAKENSGTRMETTTKGAGSTGRLMDKAYTPQPMEALTSAYGRMTSSMARAEKHGLMAHSLMEIITWAKNMAMANTGTLMVPVLMEIGAIT
jgi:hypothetical protein